MAMNDLEMIEKVDILVAEARKAGKLDDDAIIQLQDEFRSLTSGDKANVLLYMFGRLARND